METIGWHYQINGRSIGPVAVDVIVREIAQGRLSGRTPVWHEGLPDWTTLAESELVVHLKVPLNEELIANRIGTLNRLFNAYWIVLGCALAATLAALVFSGIAVWNASLNQWSWHTGWVVTAISVTSGAAGVWIGFKVLWAIILYKAWQSVPPECAETTPGKAVVLLFIPIFNWYWVYVAVYNLAKDLNAEMQREKIRAPLVNEGLCRGFCIFYSLMLLVVTIPFALVLGILVPRELRKGCLAIWKNRLRQRLADLRRAEQIEKEQSS